MFHKMKVRRQIKSFKQRILYLEQKRARSQAALVDAILKKEQPNELDVEYFNQFTAEINRLRNDMRELEKEI